MSVHSQHCNHSSTLSANHSCTVLCNHNYMIANLNERIRDIREKAGDNPHSAAKKLGISRAAYIKWEQGTTENMKLGNLLTFCDKFRVDLVELLAGETNYPTPAKATELQVEQTTHRYTSDENLNLVAESYSRLPDDRKYKINIALINQLMEEKGEHPDFDTGDIGKLLEIKR